KMEAIIVVAEIDDTRSAMIARENMDPIAKGIRSAPQIGKATAIAIGGKIDIGPQEVPVAQEINTPLMRKSIPNGIDLLLLSVAPTTYSAVPSSSVTTPIDHAKIIMSIAGSIVVIPANTVSSSSLKPTR